MEESKTIETKSNKDVAEKVVENEETVENDPVFACLKTARKKAKEGTAAPVKTPKTTMDKFKSFFRRQSFRLFGQTAVGEANGVKEKVSSEAAKDTEIEATEAGIEGVKDKEAEKNFSCEVKEKNDFNREKAEESNVKVEKDRAQEAGVKGAVVEAVAKEREIQETEVKDAELEESATEETVVKVAEEEEAAVNEEEDKRTDETVAKKEKDLEGEVKVAGSEETAYKEEEATVAAVKVAGSEDTAAQENMVAEVKVVGSEETADKEEETAVKVAAAEEKDCS